MVALLILILMGSNGLFAQNKQTEGAKTTLNQDDKLIETASKTFAGKTLNDICAVQADGTLKFKKEALNKLSRTDHAIFRRELARINDDILKGRLDKFTLSDERLNTTAESSAANAKPTHNCKCSNCPCSSTGYGGNTSTACISYYFLWIYPIWGKCP